MSLCLNTDEPNFNFLVVTNVLIARPSICFTGPFPVGEWSIFVPVPYYALVMPWMLQHRGDFSMIVHPNTGYEYEDHR